MILEKKYFVTIVGGKKINSKEEKLITLQRENEYALRDFSDLLKSVITEYKRQKGSSARKKVFSLLSHSLGSDNYIFRVSKMCAVNNINIKDFTFAETLELNHFMLFQPIFLKKQRGVSYKDLKDLRRLRYYEGEFILPKALADTGGVKEDFISVLADFNRTDSIAVPFEGEDSCKDDFILFTTEAKFDNSVPVTILYNLYGLEDCKFKRNPAAESSILDIAEIVKFYNSI